MEVIVLGNWPFAPKMKLCNCLNSHSTAHMTHAKSNHERPSTGDWKTIVTRICSRQFANRDSVQWMAVLSDGTFPAISASSFHANNRINCPGNISFYDKNRIDQTNNMRHMISAMKAMRTMGPLVFRVDCMGPFLMEPVCSKTTPERDECFSKVSINTGSTGNEMQFLQWNGAMMMPYMCVYSGDKSGSVEIHT